MSTSSTTRAQAAERGGRGRGGTPDRVPVPTRQRRPGLAALAIVLILGGAALSGYLVLTSGEKTEILAARSEIKAGQSITGADLVSVSVAVDGGSATYFSSSQVDAVTSQLAKITIPEGTLITDLMVEKATTSDCTEVSFAVQEGFYTPVTPGDVVKLFFYPKEDSGAPVTLPSVLAEQIYVTAFQTTTTAAGSGARVTVLARNAGGAGGADVLTEANSFGGIQMVKLPGADAAAVMKACAGQ